MRQVMYFLGRALQLLGLATITAVVIFFFTKMSMEPLLIWSLVGITEFYLGTFLLRSGEKG
ncbi:MAG: hypothetical protein JSU88_02225 [Nitrospinaceae bacterium]|jgi:hypothetical protein|nr:MAG: hypothetical protein JSU88_02225 [Nitrospinaceae bacterium]